MKVLITGGNGFIAKEIISYFKRDQEFKTELIVTNRDTLDVRDPIKVKDFFDKNHVDIVIHTAVKGGKRNRKDTIVDFFDNIIMFDNLATHSHKFKLMFNFGSGAEFDRSTDIYYAKESSIYDRYPDDYYGLSKNLIARKIIESNCNIINLRIFGCFGPNEISSRLIKNTVQRFRNNKTAVIHQDRFMDYVCSEDVYRVLKYIVLNYDNIKFKDVNICYEEKKSLKDIVYLIKSLTDSPCDVIINTQEHNLSYVGNPRILKQLDVSLVGLEQGLKDMLKKI